jgi:histone H3/H4
MPAAKKDCKYGARVAGKCPLKPCAGGRPRSITGKCATKDCKYGPRVATGPRGTKVKCPPKSGTGVRRHGGSIQDITAPGVRRIIAMAGVTALVSGLVYEETRGYLSLFLENVIKTASIIAQYRKVKRITDNDVLMALDTMLRTGRIDAALIPKAGDRLKACPAKVSKGSAGTCLAFPRASMSRLMDEVLHDISRNQTITPAAREMIHVLAEKYLVRLIRDAEPRRAGDKTPPTEDDTTKWGPYPPFYGPKGWVLMPRHLMPATNG